MTWEFAVRLAKACLAASFASALIAGTFAACTSSQIKQKMQSNLLKWKNTRTAVMEK